MGKSWDEFTQSLSNLQGLGIKGIWNAFINGSTEAGDALENDTKLIEKFIAASNKNASQSKLDKITDQMSAQARVYVNQMDKATLSADDFAASQTRAAVAMNTLQGVGKKAIAVVGNMLTTFAISAAVNLVIQGVTWLIERQENLRQAALEAGSALDEQTSSINNYKEQISSLRESLDEGNLSENEAYEARKQLISIQDELVDKFGAEAEGIDLVNGKYQEQLDILNDISDSKANSYLTENYDKIKEAQQEMMKQRSYMTDRETTYITATDADSERLRKIMEKYTDQGVQYFDNGRTNPFTNKKRIDLTITADASQAKETLESLYADISKDSQLSEATKSAVNSQISEWSNQAQDIARSHSRTGCPIYARGKNCRVDLYGGSYLGGSGSCAVCAANGKVLIHGGTYAVKGSKADQLLYCVGAGQISVENGCFVNFDPTPYLAPGVSAAARQTEGGLVYEV